MRHCGNCKKDLPLKKFSSGYLACADCRARRTGRSDYHAESEMMGCDRRLLNYLRMSWTKMTIGGYTAADHTAE